MTGKQEPDQRPWKGLKFILIAMRSNQGVVARGWPDPIYFVYGEWTAGRSQWKRGTSGGLEFQVTGCFA